MLGAAALAVVGGLLLTGCQKDSPSWWGDTPREVEVTLASFSVAKSSVRHDLNLLFPLRSANIHM